MRDATRMEVGEKAMTILHGMEYGIGALRKATDLGEINRALNK